MAVKRIEAISNALIGGIAVLLGRLNNAKGVSHYRAKCQHYLGKLLVLVSG
jgi:hypothetical protein